MSTTFDPAALRPFVEPLSPSAIIALYQAALDRPCWTCPIEAHGGLASVWTLRDRAIGFEHGSIVIPVEADAILEAAAIVLRAKGYHVGGWNLTTIMGTRAWLAVDKYDYGGGREMSCYVQGAGSPIEMALLVLAAADEAPRSLRPEEDEPTVS